MTLATVSTASTTSRDAADGLIQAGKTLRIASVNVNGLRAAYKKRHGGMAGRRGTWTSSACRKSGRPTRSSASCSASGWHILHAEAEAKGRAGVAIASRAEPTATRADIGDDYFATAGRWVEADFAVRDADGDTDPDRGQRLRALRRGGHPQAGRQVPLPGRHDPPAAAS